MMFATVSYNFLSVIILVTLSYYMNKFMTRFILQNCFYFCNLNNCFSTSQFKDFFTALHNIDFPSEVSYQHYVLQLCYLTPDPTHLVLLNWLLPKNHSLLNCVVPFPFSKRRQLCLLWTTTYRVPPVLSLHSIFDSADPSVDKLWDSWGTLVLLLTTPSDPTGILLSEAV